VSASITILVGLHFFNNNRGNGLASRSREMTKH
jgi:hypothetical protein